jgi:hypothetical protein
VQVKSKNWADNVEEFTHVDPMMKLDDPKKYWRWVAEDAFRRGFQNGVELIGRIVDENPELPVDGLWALIQSARAVSFEQRFVRKHYGYSYLQKAILKVTKKIRRWIKPEKRQ